MDPAQHMTAGIPRTPAMTWFALILAGLVFVLDLQFLHGQGEAVLYVIVVLIFLWSTHWRWVLWVAALCTLLTFIGFVFSRQEVFVDALVTNHTFAFAAIWFTAILGLWTNRLSDQLGESELLMRTIVESAAEGIVTTDEAGRIESCNQSAAKIFGYGRDELIGENISKLTDNVTQLAKVFGRRSHVTPCSARPHELPLKVTCELAGVRRDRTEFPILIAASEMWLHRRRLFSAIVLDMTELRTAQESAIQSARLAAIGEAMTGLAHESRNALQRSQAALEMLAREVAGQDQAAELIDRIQAAQDDLHKLYEEVRRYAAPMKLSIQPCRIDDCVYDAWEKMELVRQGREVEFHCHASTDLQDIVCEVDSFVMRRVFRNLFENSLAAAGDPVRIEVTFSATTIADKPAIAIRVRDNGPGLTELSHAKLFEPFFTTKATGTGLGIAIIRRALEEHGGTITASRPTADGAEFFLTVPRTQS